MTRFLRNNRLTLVLLGAFLFSLAGMAISGLEAENADLRAHGQPAISLTSYLVSGAFISALFENWESEFLQMSAYVMLTAVLFQKGSAESRDPDHPDRPGDDNRRRAPETIASWAYAHSLGIALTALFVFSFVAHWLGSVAAANEDAAQHGRPLQTAVQYLLDPELWFESFQNWQSEFLATAVLVVLSIFLRFRGSPESKVVTASDEDTGA